MHVYATFVFQEALQYFNQTTKQKEMLEFALNYLQTEDEVSCFCTDVMHQYYCSLQSYRHRK